MIMLDRCDFSRLFQKHLTVSHFCRIISPGISPGAAAPPWMSYSFGPDVSNQQLIKANGKMRGCGPVVYG